MKGKISEVFESIQGEGVYLGERQIFVRFFGCNLECRFCDTRLNTFFECEPEELFEMIKKYPRDYHSIAFTGGEPLLQKDFLKAVLELTHSAGYRNYLETNGTLFVELKEIIDYVDIVAMDLKLASSTGMENYWRAHRHFLEIASRKEVFLKAVICTSTEEEDLLDGIKLIKEILKAPILVLQPNSYEDRISLDRKLERFRDICINENIPACIIPQVHKVIGVR